MTINDYEQAYNLWTHATGLGLNEVDDSRKGINQYLMRNPNTCFIAEDNEKIVGTIMCGHDGRRGFIYHAAVNIEYQGRGIGKELVNSALTALEQEGIHKVALVAIDKNVSENAFWEKIGFTERNDLVYRNKFIHELPKIDLT